MKDTRLKHLLRDFFIGTGAMAIILLVIFGCLEGARRPGSSDQFNQPCTSTRIEGTCTPTTIVTAAPYVTEPLKQPIGRDDHFFAWPASMDYHSKFASETWESRFAFSKDGKVPGHFGNVDSFHPMSDCKAIEDGHFHYFVLVSHNKRTDEIRYSKVYRILGVGKGAENADFFPYDKCDKVYGSWGFSNSGDPNLPTYRCGNGPECDLAQIDSGETRFMFFCIWSECHPHKTIRSNFYEVAPMK